MRIRAFEAFAIAWFSLLFGSIALLLVETWAARGSRHASVSIEPGCTVTDLRYDGGRAELAGNRRTGWSTRFPNRPKVLVSGKLHGIPFRRTVSLPAGDLYIDVGCQPSRFRIHG